VALSPREKVHIVLVVAALVSVAALVAPAGSAVPRLSSAVYRDAGDENAAAADISRVAVADDRRTVTVRVWIANRLEASSDMGLQIVIDSDRRQATGDQSLVYSLGADYLVQMLAGTVRLLRWDERSRRWVESASQPSWSYDSGRATIRLAAAALRNPTDFLFQVSTASGLVVEADGIDITTAHFDFAPDAGRGGWRFRVARPHAASRQRVERRGH
jgi:hypothetical protein